MLVEGAWSYRYPARVTETETLSRPPGKRTALRALPAPDGGGQEDPVVVAAIAREMAAFLWAIGHQIEPVHRDETRDFWDDHHRNKHHPGAGAATALSLSDMGLVEINEAFAVQVLAVLKGLDWDHRAQLNVNGSGISLGHPIGATGVRIMTTLLYEMARRKLRYGLETMCVGGGQGMAAIFEQA